MADAAKTRAVVHYVIAELRGRAGAEMSDTSLQQRIADLEAQALRLIVERDAARDLLGQAQVRIATDERMIAAMEREIIRLTQQVRDMMS